MTQVYSVMGRAARQGRAHYRSRQRKIPAFTAVDLRSLRHWSHEDDSTWDSLAAAIKWTGSMGTFQARLREVNILPQVARNKRFRYVGGDQV